MIIGGGKLYYQTINRAKRLYLTYIHTIIKGDTYFPYFSLYQWKNRYSSFHKSDALHAYDYCFKIFEKNS